MRSEPIIVEKVLQAPVDRVWKAITDRKEMEKWYFKMEAFKPEVGFEFKFEGSDGTTTYLHHCKVTEVITNKKLRHSWRYEGHPGISYVTWELFEEGKGKTRLKLTHEGLETFPDVPAFARKNFVGGWNEIIGTHLPKHVEANA